MKAITKQIGRATGRLFNTVEPLSEIKNYETLKADLYRLSPLTVNKDRNKAKNDARQHSLSYDSADGLPPALSRLLSYINYVYEPLGDKKADLPLNSLRFKVSYVASMYKAAIAIPLPHPETMVRFLINVGYNEVYHLERDPMDSASLLGVLSTKAATEGMLDNQTVYLPQDTLVVLPPGPLSAYKISIRANPPAQKPSLNPMDPPMAFYRFPGQKITIVVDFIDDTNTVARQTAEGIDLINKADKELIKTLVKADGLQETLHKTEIGLTHKQAEESLPDDDDIRRRMNGEESIDEETRRRMEGDN